jgi:outer membrane protein OmpA-like peptidoglycan-associated protein
MNLHLAPSPAACAARAALAAALVSAGGNALSLPGASMLGRFDFGYALQGDPAARPVQVFSDGAGTVYFQVAPGMPAPAIFAGQGRMLLVPQVRGPYQVVRSRATEFTLALGTARARVVRGGAAPAQPPASPEVPSAAPLQEGGGGADAAGGSPSADAAVAQLGRAMREGRQLASVASGAPAQLLRWTEPERTHEAPIVFEAGSAVLSPQAAAVLDAVAARLGAESHVTLEARRDVPSGEALAVARLGALRVALAARGVPASRVTERASQTLSEPLSSPEASSSDRRVAAIVRWTTPAAERALDLAAGALPAVSASPTWDITPADRELAGALRRWAARAGYRVEWPAAIVAPVTGEGRVEAASFVEAVGRVVAGLQARGYPLRAFDVGDRTIRFEEVR